MSTDTITVPFCFLPNSKSQTFDMTTTKRSRFQIEKLKEISQRPDFAYFTTVSGEQQVIVDPDYRCHFYTMWYAKDGTCHGLDLGLKRILHETTPTAVPSPVPLDSIVYKVRCN